MRCKETASDTRECNDKRCMTSWEKLVIIMSDQNQHKTPTNDQCKEGPPLMAFLINP